MYRRASSTMATYPIANIKQQFTNELPSFDNTYLKKNPYLTISYQAFH